MAAPPSEPAPAARAEGGCTDCSCTTGGASKGPCGSLKDLEDLGRGGHTKRGAGGCCRTASASSPNGTNATSDGEAVRLPKAQKRIAAKVAKQRTDAYAALGKILKLSEDGLSTTFERVPRRTLLVVNASSAGLAAITAEALEGVFSPYEGFERVFMTHGQPYSFALFRSGDEAQVAKDALHARLCPQLRVGKVLFLEYVTHRTFARMAGVAEEGDTRADELPPGLDFYPDFVTEEEERAMLAAIEQEESKPIYVQGRRVRHYGYAFDYHIKHVSRERALLTRMELPPWTDQVEERLRLLSPWGGDTPDQLTVQHYPPGAGIGFHADSHTAFEGGIAIISLGAAVVMDFRHPHSEAGGSWPKGQGNPRPLKGGTSIDLLPRSLLLITGEARYNWEHAIRPRRSDPAPEPTGIRTRQDRWSLTFRTVKKDVECACGGPLCDTDNHVVRELRAERRQAAGGTDASPPPFHDDASLDTPMVE